MIDFQFENEFNEFVQKHVKPFKESMFEDKQPHLISTKNIMKWSKICFEFGARSQHK